MSIEEKAHEQEKKTANEAKKLSKFFELTVTIKIFGYTVIQWVFPPKKD